MNERAVGRPWTAEEDQLLATAVAVHGEADSWKTVALAVPGRSNKACRKRWLHSLSPNVKKTAWTREEDDLLLELYKIHSAKWALIARSIPGRTDDACSKRYREALDPALKKDEWTQDEDDRLVAAYNALGGRWGRVGQELHRSGLGCRNRWRLLQRKRAAASSIAGQGSFFHQDHFSARWPPLDMSDSYFVPVLPPFHYSSSSLSSALAPDPALVLPPPVFPPFDYDALSASSTSPAPQPSYPDDMHRLDAYSDRPHQFHQLHSSARPVQVDHYSPPAPHEESTLSHPALTTRRQPTPQSTPLRAPSSADPFFASAQLPEQLASHVSSSMTSVSLLDDPDPYYHASPDPQLDVNPQHPLLASPDPLPLSESRPGYHYAQQPDHSRPRVVETMRGQEPHADYRHPQVQPDHVRHALPSSSRLATASPDARYALLQPEPRAVNPPAQPEAGPSRTSPEFFDASQLVRRSTASPRFVATPYPKRPAVSGSSADAEGHAMRPIPRQKNGAGKQSDTQAPLRLSSDLQAAPDASIKPYACGHESCWPPNAASSRASYCTSRGLSDHNKAVHPDDAGRDRPYRCGLEGCGKSWKSINGLQYHLQISKAHFQHAITSSIVCSYISGLSVPASVEASTSKQGEDKTKKHYQCPHENCPNRYKQLSGLRYHLAHGHPVDLPKQLDLVPPALSRKLAEKMRAQGAVVPSSERPTRGDHPESSQHSEGGTFDS